jgi:hypothetical protein
MAQPNSAVAMTVARNAAFMDRVDYYAKKAAIDVMAEPGNTAGHAARVTFAGKVLDGSYDVAAYAAGVVTNGTVAAEVAPAVDDFGVPDSDLAFVVNSLFSAYAGVAL